MSQRLCHKSRGRIVRRHGLSRRLRAPAPAPARNRLPNWAASARSGQFWTREIFTGSEDRLFLFLAILIGVFSGLAVVCFRVAIEWTQFAVLGSTLAPTVPRFFWRPQSPDWASRSW